MSQPSVFKKILPNGLVVLVSPVSGLPKISLQLLYHVGSKDEKEGQKGLAHLIEHMIFKGTDTLSETDLDAVANKLSAYTNAYTNHDYTGYIFDVPAENWKKIIPLFVDCMRNCRFDEQMLNSELKAVIQELKMFKDDYFDTLLQGMYACMFKDHPYHYPIIGFKQDLWNLKRDSLVDFYKKQYVPNNAVLVVTGDVDVQDVFQEIEKQFASIPKDPTFTRAEQYISKDLVSQSVAIYRDVQQPQVVAAYMLPGAKTKNSFLTEVIACLLGQGKSSLLYKKIVDDLQLASSLDAGVDQMEDATVLYFVFQPFEETDAQKIVQLIQKELDTLVEEGISLHELQRAQKQVKSSHLTKLEDLSARATMIGQNYLFTGDENSLFEDLEVDSETAGKDIQTLFKTYCSYLVRYEGKILPLHEGQHEQLNELQMISDQEDARILDGRVRSSLVEAPDFVHTVTACAPNPLQVPVPDTHTLKNGLEVFTYTTDTVPKIQLVMSLAVKEYSDPVDLQGLYEFTGDMLFEGTKKYPGGLFAQEVEGYGMSLTVEPGYISLSVLKEDFQKGLEFLFELVEHAIFAEKDIEKVRSHLLSSLTYFWDEPQDFAGHVTRKIIYEGHPYSKNPRGTKEGFEKITKKDLVTFYKQAFTPQGACLSIVGDTRGYDVFKEVEKFLGAWEGQKPLYQEYPSLKPVVNTVHTYPIQRDQVVLIFAGISVDRLDPDYDLLLLFDEIFSNGMSSRLFQLREQTGLFYTIGGSLAVGCDEQPGMVYVSTIVSLDYLDEAQDLIKEVIDMVIDTVIDAEIEQAKVLLRQNWIDNFASQQKIACSFLNNHRYNFTEKYVEERIARLSGVTLSQVKAAAKKVLDLNKMITLQVGRVGKNS